MSFDKAHVLGLDSHQWPEADGYLVPVDACDRADQFHMLANHSLPSRIDNRMREVVGGDRHAHAIGRHPAAHNRRDCDLVANFDTSPSDAQDLGAAGAGVKMRAS